MNGLTSLAFVPPSTPAKRNLFEIHNENKNLQFDGWSNKSRILILKLLPVTTESIYAISFDLLPIWLSCADFFESLNCTGTARELLVKRKEKVSLCLKMFVFDQELYMLYMNHSKFGTTTFYSTYNEKTQIYT